MKQDFQVTCPFCAVGCQFNILKGMDEVVFSRNTQDNIDFDYKNPVNEGALCPRGHFSYELLSHPKRLGRAFYKDNGLLTPEIPEMIFQKFVTGIDPNQKRNPIAILFDPMISLHDIRALLDFAKNDNIKMIDFISPTDRHLFRGMLDNPFIIKPLHDIRLLRKINFSLCIGDIFTKQPVLSRHLLQAKYAFRKNALFSINTISSRTSWFANRLIENSPHLEPLHLFYLFKQIYKNKRTDTRDEALTYIYDLIKATLDPIITTYLHPSETETLDSIAQTLNIQQNSAIYYSPHHYSAATGYLIGILAAGISQMIDGYFIPLYTDSNLYALEDLSTQVYQDLKIGKQPILFQLMKNKFQFLFAAGWNPETAIPGNFSIPQDTKLIISSLVQDQFPKNTLALLPQTHLYEQMDLRMNLQALQSKGSEKIKDPIGSAQSISQYIYQLHQQMTERNIKFRTINPSPATQEWNETFNSEVQYYLKKLNQIYNQKGTWIIPNEHVAHFKDGSLTQYSSWAKKDCICETLIISEETAKKRKIHDGQYFNLNFKGKRIIFKVQTNKKISPDKLICYAHYLPFRKKIPGEFASHNSEYYFWCPKVSL